MPAGSATWSFSEKDFDAITRSLGAYVEEAGCRTVLLVDRSGQLIVAVGESPKFDTTAFASLTAADFSANDQLARMIGNDDFNSLFHQGERESMYIADVSRRLMLVALFDNRTTLGLVRLRTRQEVERLARLCERMFSEEGRAQQGPGVLAGAEDEIDQLFK